MGTTFEQDFSPLTFALRFADATAFLRLEGEIDSAALPVLTDIAMLLNDRVRAAVFIDLGGVSFAGSALIHFLYRVATDLPAGAALVLCRPEPATIRLIQLVEIDRMIQLTEHLPEFWPLDELDRADSQG